MLVPNGGKCIASAHMLHRNKAFLVWICRCEFAKHTPSVGTTVYEIQLLLLVRNQLLSKWSYTKSAIIELFLSRLVVHHVNDVNVTDVRSVVVGSGTRTARAGDQSLAVYVNVTNIPSAAAAEVMRARLNALTADTFPGFILARFLNATEYSIAVDPVQSETISGAVARPPTTGVARQWYTPSQLYMGDELCYKGHFADDSHCIMSLLAESVIYVEFIPQSYDA